MNTHKTYPPTLIGSIIGFILFIVFGSVPGLLYGGYMGLALCAALFGAPVVTTGISSIIIFGGMFLGILATAFFFLVMGAALGTAVGFVLTPIYKAFKSPNRLAEARVEKSL